MLLETFYFLKYVKPVWYFNVTTPEIHGLYWLDYEKLSETDQKVVDVDFRFSSSYVQKVDAAYQALNRGVIPNDQSIALPQESIKGTVKDNYLFIRKYFSPIWLIYVLLNRLVSFKAPWVEIPGFFAALKHQRQDLFEPNHKYEAYDSFESELVNKKPTVSIILPTLNRYEHLKNAIDDLLVQTVMPLEIMVVDQTDNPDKDFYKQYDSNMVKVTFQQEKGQWLSRNTAIRDSKGDYILMFDDDSRVEKDWVEEHLKGLDYFNADISAGVSLSTVGAAIPRNYGYFRWADQFDSGNALLKRSVFESLGMFDRQYDGQRMGDGEFGIRAMLAGFKSISHPFASRIHLKVPAGGLRQMGSWDGFRPKKLTAPRPIPSVVFLFRTYYGEKLTKLALKTLVPPSIMPYKFKKNPLMMLVGVFLSILLLPFIFYQVNRSWQEATKMMNEGPKIEPLPKRPNS